MSDLQKKSDLSEQDLTRLALQAVALRPLGKAPDLLEIERFRKGDLREPRRSEVLSHLARDTDAFALLQQLEHADAELQQLESGSGQVKSPRAAQPLPLSVLRRLRDEFTPLVQWMQPRPFALLATVVLGLIVLMVAWPWLHETSPLDQIDDLESQLASAYNPSPEAWHWAPKPAVRPKKQISFGARRNEPEHTAEKPPAVESLRRFGTEQWRNERADDAVRVGVRQGLAALVGDDPEWAASLAALPSALPECAPDSTSCPDVVEAVAATGRWATLLYWQCHAEPMPEAFWQAQDRLRVALVTKLRSDARALALTLQGWTGDSPPQSRLCRGAENFLDDVLTRRR
jgi:hypothetical protein